MAFVDKALNSVLSIDKFHYAVITKNDNTGYTHPAMKEIPGLIEISFNTETATGELYADGMKVYSDSAVVGISLNTTLASVPVGDRAAMLGNDYNDTTDVLSVKTSDVAPEIAIAFRAQFRDGQYKYYKFNVAKAEIGEQTATTKSGDITYQTEELVFNCVAKTLDAELS